jgi:hypothetical protein
VKNLQLIVNSTNVPRHPLKPNFETDSGYLREYYMLLEELGANEGNISIDLTAEDFKGGYAIFPFRITTRHDHGELLGVPIQGSVKLTVEFASALADHISVLVLSEKRGTRAIEGVIPQ